MQQKSTFALDWNHRLFCSVIETTFAARLHNRKQNTIITHKEHWNEQCIHFRMNAELMS